ncbi:MAG TPA: hypothetical protein VFQ70_02510, partial [Candidatus Saccharimonadaceae bacterium]|nr:hypothetical protein [Candidatus Saccharimonadaceae bacterium]
MKNVRDILRYTSGLKRLFVIITISSIIGALLSLATPFVIRGVTNMMVAIVSHQAEFSLSRVLFYAILILIIMLLNTILGDIGGYFGDIMAVR